MSCTLFSESLMTCTPPVRASGGRNAVQLSSPLNSELLHLPSSVNVYESRPSLSSQACRVSAEHARQEEHVAHRARARNALV